MAQCSNCSASLPPDATVCRYCGTRNDIDLRGIHHFTVHEPESERTCPRCSKPLRTINLKTKGNFFIEQCNECLGFFFDPGELEALLETSVTNVFEIDYQRLNTLNRERRAMEHPIRYLKCPVCGELMNRKNFGARSGVVVDKCRNHGVWLDGGELRHLMEWMKSGGRLLHQKHREEEEKQKKLRERRRLEQEGISTRTSLFGSERGYSSSYREWSSSHNDNDLFDLLTRVVEKLFS